MREQIVSIYESFLERSDLGEKLFEDSHLIEQSQADRRASSFKEFEHLFSDSLCGKIRKVKAVKGTVGEQAEVKRAIVTLEEGHRIDVTTGL